MSNKSTELVILTRTHCNCCALLQDLVYKGIIKVVYDRGFALQSKAILVESVTTVAQVIQHATEAFNLIGVPEDYALEERDILVGSQLYKCMAIAGSYNILCSKPITVLNRNSIAKKTELWLTRILHGVSTR